MCNCKCNYPQRYRAETITVATGTTTITLPATAEIEAGNVYDILLATVIPAGTDGTNISITNGTQTGAVMRRNGNYYRPIPLTSRTILRVQFFDDPAHFQLIAIKR